MSTLPPAARRSVVRPPIARRGGVLSAVALAAGLAAAASVGAQPYRSFPPNTALKNKGQTVKRFVKNPTGDEQARQLYEQFFNEYYFRAMTQFAPDTIGEIGKLRFDLFKQYLWNADPSIQADLTTKAGRFALGVIRRQKEFHPTVVYNAVLVLGGLDAEYAIDGNAGRRPPRPLPAANRKLCELVAKSVKDELPLHILAGSLVGLERHTRYFRNLPRDARNTTARALIAAAGKQDFPEGVGDDVRGWLKRQACQGLANLGAPGARGVFLNALAGVAGDASLPLAVRCDVCAMIGGMSFDGARNLDAKPTCDAMTGLAVAVADEHAATANEFRDLQLQGSGGRRGGSRGRGGMLDLLDPLKFYTDEEDNRVRLQRRPIAATLASLRKGVEVVGPVAGDRGPAFTTIADAVKQAEAVVGDEQSLDLDVADALLEFSRRLEPLRPEPPAGSGARGEPGSDTREAPGSGDREPAGSANR